MLEYALSWDAFPLLSPTQFELRLGSSGPSESNDQKHRNNHNINLRWCCKRDVHISKCSVVASVASVDAFQSLTLFMLSIVLNISES